jgi:hypothetical protein
MAYNPTSKWAYYLRGREIAVVTYEVDSKSGTAKWGTPTKDVQDQLQVEYTFQPAIPATEANELDVTATLSQALVYFLRACDAERAGKFDISQYMFKQFYRLAALDNNNRRGGPRILIPSGTSVLG